VWLESERREAEEPEIIQRQTTVRGVRESAKRPQSDDHGARVVVSYTPVVRCVVIVMHKLEAMRILEAKLKSVEEERHAELAENEDLRNAIDAKAEAKALSAVFDFLKTHKIVPSNSLLSHF
jgi:hypothetical protein